MGVTSLVSLEEYLATSYRPDREYIDGEARLKGGQNAVLQWTHSNLRYQLAVWFGGRRKEWGITGGVESRMQVTATEVLLPDFVVDYSGSRPEVLIIPPLIAIEILSPSDSFSQNIRKIGAYLAMGVPNMWLIDPETRIGYVCRKYGPPQPARRFEVDQTPIYLDLTELFAAFDEDNA